MAKRRFLGLIIVFAFIITSLTTTALAVDSDTIYSGGNGTQDDPYQISTADDLIELAKNVNNGVSYQGKSFKLTNDIDLGGNDNNQWTPIGYFDNTGYPFAGTFDGDGHKISGLYIKSDIRKDYQGLFGYNTGTIKNVIISGTISDELGWYIGALVGVNDQGTINDCYNFATISGGSYSGGIVGYNNSGVIHSCYNGGTISSVTYAGGITGYNSGNSIESCYNITNVSGSGYIGGISGGNADSGTIKGCYNTAGITGAGSYVGGIAGTNSTQSILENCHNTGAISGSSYTGGIIGYNGYISGGGSVTLCSNAGKVTGTGNNTGGIAGNNANSGSITNCYNITEVISSGNNVGGVVGFNNSIVKNCYNDASIQGSSNAGGIVGWNSVAGNLSSSYNKGQVNGNDAGSAVGYNFGSLTYCYYLAGTADQGIGSDSGTGSAESKQIEDFESISNFTGFEETVWEVDPTLEKPVLISNYQSPAYTVTFNPNDGTDGITAISGISGNYSLPLCTFTAPSGKQFVSWAIDSIDGTQYDPKDIYSVDENVTFYAVWENTYIPQYSVTVNGGTATPSEAEEYEIITITATIPGGQRFTGWSVESGNVTLSDSTSETTTFIMPSSDVTITANFESVYIPSIDIPTYPPTINQPEEGGSINITPRYPTQGQTVTIIPSPNNGYEVDDVTVTDRNGNDIEIIKNENGTYTFTQPAMTVTISATFREVSHICPSTHFIDVNLTSWYHEALDYVLDAGLMNGTSETTFEPNSNTSRAMIVTILYRLAGSPSMDNEIWGYPYSDVNSNAYYSTAVYWARLNGIVNGYSDELFGPDDPITREQLVSMLYRYAQYIGHDISVDENTNIFSYSDFEEISEYAIPAMQWACGTGILNGTDISTLEPNGTATRAQAAAMIQRFCNQVI